MWDTVIEAGGGPRGLQVGKPRHRPGFRHVGIVAAVVGIVAAVGAAAAQPQAAAKDDVLAACGANRPTAFWFGMDQILNGSSDKILDMTQAVRARREAQKTGRDRLAMQIQSYRQTIARLEDSRLKRPEHSLPSPAYEGQEECARRYLALLGSFEAESLSLAQKQADQDSAGRIEQGRQQHEAAMQAQEAVAAEAARRRREAEVAAQQADEERRRREVLAVEAEKEATVEAARQQQEMARRAEEERRRIEEIKTETQKEVDAIGQGK